MDRELSPGAERHLQEMEMYIAKDVQNGRLKPEDAAVRLEGERRIAEIADRTIETGGKGMFEKGPGGIVREAQKNKDVTYSSGGSIYVQDAIDKKLIDRGVLEGVAISIVRHEFELSKEQNPQAAEALDKAYNSSDHWHAKQGGYGQAAFLKETLSTLEARGLAQPVKGKAKETTMSNDVVNSMAAGKQM
ncbi:MAG: hypothetical protein LBL47_04445 [Lactobacillus sp.]|jgi:hypothetical protein|nr:hypothetical protein [Lactobacillus sp.]